MVTLEDISLTLRKPAKDLMKWNSPFSETLEKYYSSFEHPNDINFGEVALILQNLANVYVKRVESLHNETTNLNDAFIEYENKEEQNPAKPHRKRKKKSSIDLNDFQLLDLKKEVGKNINFKNESAQKHIKLISRRFTQLEENPAHLRVSIELCDIHGEMIGKKYDFRCNHYLNVDGILVEEFGYDDFTPRKNDDICDDDTNVTCSDNDFDVPEDNLMPTTDGCSSTNDSGFSSMSESLFNQSITISSTSSQPIINPDDPIDRLEDDVEDNTESSIVVDSNGNSECTPNPENDRILEKSKNKRDKNKKIVPTVTNEKIWQPIPFTEEPCQLSRDITSTDSRPGKRKREIVSTPQNRKRPPPFIFDDSEISPANIQSPSQKVAPLIKEEFEDFEKSFYKCFKNISNEVLDYEAITTITMDLIGFRPNLTKKDPILDAVIDPIQTDISSVIPALSPFELPDAPSPRPSSPFDEFSPIETSSVFTEDYHSMVARKINRICETSNVRTDMERAIENWHQRLHPKLIEAEKRPIFCVRDYNNKIVNTLKNTNEQRVTFDSVVREEPPSEVARYFLATLQLANTYNLDINASKDDGSNIELILLDGQRP